MSGKSAIQSRYGPACCGLSALCWRKAWSSLNRTEPPPDLACGLRHCSGGLSADRRNQLLRKRQSLLRRGLSASAFVASATSLTRRVPVLHARLAPPTPEVSGCQSAPASPSVTSPEKTEEMSPPEPVTSKSNDDLYDYVLESNRGDWMLQHQLQLGMQRAEEKKKAAEEKAAAASESSGRSVGAYRLSKRRRLLCAKSWKNCAPGRAGRDGGGWPGGSSRAFKTAGLQQHLLSVAPRAQRHAHTPKPILDLSLSSQNRPLIFAHTCRKTGSQQAKTYLVWFSPSCS